MLPLSPLPRTLSAALRDARHDKQAVRLSALRDLARLAEGEGRDQALSALGRALREDANPAVRAAAALAIADARASECVEPIVLATRDENDRVRQMAFVALAEIAPSGNERARDAAERALRDAEPAIRFQGLIVLYRVVGDDAVPLVIEKLRDTDREIRYVALRLLEEHFIGAGRQGAPREDVPVEVRERVGDGLTDDAAEVRLASAIFLAHCGVDAGRAVLADAVNARRAQRDPEDEQAAIELAGELRLETARGGLERRAFGGLFSRDRFAWQARVALAKLGDPRAKESILRDLSGWTRDTRTLAVAAAGRARLLEAGPAIRAMRGDVARADPDAVAEALAALDIA
jgi:hypothetical protein